MDYRPIFFIVGILLVMLGVAMLVPAAADAISANPDWQVFLASAFLTSFIGGTFILMNRSRFGFLGVRQAFVLTTMSWIVIAAFGALPFMFSNLELSYTDAFFEAMSGITTTGSTVVTGLDSAPPGILLWRALLQWLGGIGIVVMAIGVLPMLRVGGMQLFHMESSDHSPQNDAARSPNLDDHRRDLSSADGSVFQRILGGGNVTVRCSCPFHDNNCNRRLLHLRGLPRPLRLRRSSLDRRMLHDPWQPTILALFRGRQGSRNRPVAGHAGPLVFRHHAVWPRGDGVLALAGE